MFQASLAYYTKSINVDKFFKNNYNYVKICTEVWTSIIFFYTSTGIPVFQINYKYKVKVFFHVCLEK